MERKSDAYCLLHACTSLTASHSAERERVDAAAAASAPIINIGKNQQLQFLFLSRQ